MTSPLSFHPRPLFLLSPATLSGSQPPTTAANPLSFTSGNPRSRGLLVARAGPAAHLADFEAAAQELLGRTEGLLYTLADAVVSAAASPSVDAVTVEGSKKDGDWFSGITSYMETVLKILKGGLSALHVPYSYGFAIILLTVLVKAATFPLTKKQVESALAMRSLQPQIKAIQQRYAGDQERIQLETARLYKLAGVNPLAGCLPTLATIPVWIGLYRALSNVADEGLLTEGFFWIPSLSGPTTIAARQSGSGTSWLFPFVDGQPPLGWPDTLAYLVLPVLLVISQYISAQIMQPPQTNDPSQNSSQAVTKLLPLMIGYFALSVPSGLSLYWLTNNILSTGQQIWLQKLGGAQNPVKQFSDIFQDEPSISQKPASNVQKSELERETAKVNSNQQVKANSDGLLPGERFKQIKEQEARRRKQKEEDKRRAEKEEKRRAAAATSSIINDEQNSEVKPVDGSNKMDSENNQQAAQFSTINNGSHSSKTSPTINGEQVSGENLQKDQVSEKNVSRGTQTSELDTPARRDDKLGRAED